MRFALTWPRPATALSVLGHAVFLALLAIEAPRHIAAMRPPAAVEVVMVAPAASRPPPPVTVPSPVANAGPAAAAQPEAVDRPAAPPAQPARPPSGARVTATEYFAGAVLDDPRNRTTRRKLAALGSDERLIQLCNIEAMEQLRRWKAGFVADHVVAYATADPSLTATSIEAPGAAVHAGGEWYRLSFACTATAGLDRVASFAFTLGRPIPRRQWEEDNLPELVDGDPTD
ncbi:DUF930 domain-containing protein [Pleomorphomonas carboxyditropha]|uniref:DUF930 domain-containing protein n=1 Tax=Pleomorphomonas carboxyditropha TaxID=2023338 RepID=UPI0013FE0C14|nr:DUF930 domain-containing protein [Pleomorphomonas carboxyditropha]